MNGRARPFAALRRGALRATRCATLLFCNARFLARCLSSSLSASSLCLFSDLSLLRLGSSSDFLRLRSCLPTESYMNGGARPCENPTTNIAVLPLVYFFA